MTLVINENIKNQLGLDVIRSHSIRLADGSRRDCEFVGPVTVQFKNRETTCEALVLSGIDEVLLGVIPMEGMDVMVDPTKEELCLPPDRLDKPMFRVY